MLCREYDGNIVAALANLEPRLLCLPMTSRVAVIKAICNSWCTSRRYHEAIVHPCVFGCNACHPFLPDTVFFDELSHYLVCPRMWSIVGQVTGLPVGNSAGSRLGVGMEWLDLRLLALAHHIYHSLKLGHEQLLGSISTYAGWGEVLDAAFEWVAIAKVELFAQAG